MIFVVAVPIVIVLVTLLAAVLGRAWWPGMGEGGRIALAAASAPALTVVVFTLLVIWTLVGAGGTTADRNAAGMATFALVFFFLYTMVAAVVIGVLTALVAVKGLKL